MKQLQIDNRTVEIPTTWEDITLERYEEFYLDQPTTRLDKAAYIAKICGLESDFFNALPVGVFNLVVEQVQELMQPFAAEPTNEITIDGERWNVATHDELTLAEWVDVEEIQRQKSGVLAGVLAIVCRPLGESYDCKLNEKRTPMFAKMAVGQVAGLLAFFLRCKTISDRTINLSGITQEAISRLRKAIDYYRKNGAGTKRLRIWQTIRYGVSMKYALWRLRKYSTGLSTKKNAPQRKRLSENLKRN